MIFSEESKDNNEENENPNACIMSSFFPSVNEREKYSIQAEWDNGCSLSMGVSNVLLSISWDRISSKNTINMIRRFSDIFKNLHEQLNNLEDVFAHYEEGDLRKHDFLPKKRTILEKAINDYCGFLQQMIGIPGISQEESILLVNALITWKLANIFYCKKKNSKTEEFLEWANGFHDETKPSEIEFFLRNSPENIEKTGKYWEFLYEYLSRGDYDRFAILLKKHSWRKKKNQMDDSTITKAEIIDGIIDVLLRKPRFYKQKSQNLLKEDFLKAHSKYLNYINLFIHSIDENPSEIPENDQNLKALLCLLRGDLDKIELVSQQDWKKNLCYYLQFSNPLLNREDLKNYIELLKQNMEFGPYDEVLLGIISNKKAVQALEKMNFLFPKYITSYFSDILYEFNALLTEKIQEFSQRNFQEQNIVDFLKYAQGSNLELAVAYPFIEQLRYLDEIRAENGQSNLGNSHEFLCSSLILAKIVEFDEEKIKELFTFIEKLKFSNEMGLKAKIMQREIQKAKNCEDWEALIYYNINESTQDLNDKNLLFFFLNKLYKEEQFPLELIIKTLSYHAKNKEKARNLLNLSGVLSNILNLRKFTIDKEFIHIKQGIFIVQELLDSKEFPIDYWPLLFKLFLEFTIENFNEFNYNNFDFFNQKIIKLDEYLSTMKKKANSNCICEIWMKIKGKLQYRIFKMMNKCVMSN